MFHVFELASPLKFGNSHASRGEYSQQLMQTSFAVEATMRRTKLAVAGIFAAAVLLVATLAHAAPQAAASPNFVGTWQMQMSGGGPNGGGGNNNDGNNGGNQGDNNNGGNNGGNGGGRRGGPGGGGRGPSSLVIAQDGSNYKVTHRTQRGDVTSPATLSGNTLTWTEEREGRDGNTMKMSFKATVDGDSMKGTLAGGQFTRDFTATRGTAAPAPNN
jgi:hypothetical protein